ncbi:arsenite efflux membrane protein ArsB [Sediminihabitans luteus]|uniref:Arsenite efflux membrane protein ArsB n=1 Tax=Sediminihabitans luteus TaxID=1138585 RepID=A0A2M9CQ01_9CELL|nr:SLC13 family permease [Sediminihabitans luteus]PJJ73993.1 arsenite efflux membrane protein ArsB [Sediminihabitans luteus]GII98094.1 hypothetical protein Slu03_04720 [Sediminihabitans luteus]
MRRVPWWALATCAAVAVVATGVLPGDDAVALARRTVPVLLFLAAITVVAEMCSHAGLFDVAATRAARLAGGSRARLWLLVVAMAVLSTVVLSLDTTAVLLTPVVLVVARRTGSAPLPFALTVLALANTASLLLPVSNLTNLLGMTRLEALDPPARYVAVMAAPAVVVVVVTVAVLAVLHRRALVGRFTPPPAPEVRDRVLLRWSAGTVVALAACFVAELPVAPVALAGAAVLVAVALVRGRGLPVRPADLVPWRTVLVIAALLTLVAAWHAHGLGDALTAVAGTGTSTPDLFRLGATAALGSNAVNNLPAYLALEPTAATDAARIAALLVGVDAGPLVTPWASVATLLWAQQLRRYWTGVDGPWWPVARQGLVLAPVALVAGLGVVALTA